MPTPTQARKGVTLANDIPSTMAAVAGDTGRIVQIFHHLVGNACKFTHAGSITVSAILKMDEVEVAVADTGIGIPRDKFRSIFQPFEQVGSARDDTHGAACICVSCKLSAALFLPQVDPASRREHTGTGFGLTLVKQLVEAHGGTVSLKSKVGVGTTIYVTFKVRAPPFNTSSMPHHCSMTHMCCLPLRA